MSSGDETPASAGMLELRGVRLKQGQFTLGPLDVSFGRGITALLGANGAGKSTLLRIAVGVTRPPAGTVSDGLERPLPRGIVGYLPQDFVGPSHVRVWDYLRFIAWCRSSRDSVLGSADVDLALSRVGLQDKKGAKISTLSGGMVRRLGIAQAMLGSAGILILDEPTVGLDPVQRRELRQLLAKLAKETAIVVSTHLSEDVAAIADHVVVLHDGQVVHDGSVRSLVQLAGAEEVSGESVDQGFLALVGEEGGRDAA